MLGTGLWITRFGFRKHPYASDHKLTALFALTRKAWQVKYHGEKINAFGSSDLVLNAQVNSPVLNNFFGFGNGTIMDKSKPCKFLQGALQICRSRLPGKKKIFWKIESLGWPYLFPLLEQVLLTTMNIYWVSLPWRVLIQLRCILPKLMRV